MKLRFLCFLVPAFALALIEESHAITLPDQPTVLTAQHSGKCLDIRGSATYDNASVVQNTCVIIPSQLWTFVPNSAGQYQIKDFNSGMCLDVRGASTENGAVIKQVNCGLNTQKNQLWTITERGSNVISLLSVNSGKCLDISYQSTSNDAEAIQWTCNGGSNQAFKLASWISTVSGQKLNFIPQSSNKCMDVSAASLQDGARLIQNGCKSTLSQVWSLVDLGKGQYQIVSSNSKMCADVGGASQQNGGVIQQSACAGITRKNQLWTVRPDRKGGFNFLSVNSGKCLEISSLSTVDGATLDQWDCAGQAQQAWSLKPAPIAPTPSPTPSPKPSPTPSPTPTAPPVTWGSPTAALKVSVEFTTPEYTQQATQNERIDLMSANELTPLVHFKGSSYFVWTNTHRRTMVTQITQGNIQTVPLDVNPDYLRTSDGHGRFSLGIDNLGYLHIAGDMHNYTEGTTTPYVPRYQKQTILYWKSVSPQSIANGFVFAGGKGAPTAIPGTGWTYGRFFTDLKGELYYSCRIKAINGGHYPGEIALGVYRYNTSTSTWTALGNLPPKIRPEPQYTYYKVVLWENSGFAPLPNAWFQGIMPILKFDLKNKLHMASSINSDPALAGNDRVIYAVSPDGGTTWQKASGAQIQGSPIRAIDGLPSSGEVVLEDRTKPNFGLFTSALTDQYGVQGVLQDSVWRIWNGTSWVVDSSLTYKTDQGGNLASNGSLVFTGGGNNILHTTGFGKPVYSLYLGQQFMKILALDEYALRTTGVAYGIGFTPNAKNQCVFKVTTN